MTYVFKNIKQFVTKNTMFFILFLVCEFVASLTLFLSFGTFQNFKLVKNSDIHQKNITIGFGNMIEENINEEETTYSFDGNVNNGDVKKFLSMLPENTLNELESIMYTAKSDYIDNTLNEPIEICFRMQYSKDQKKFTPFDIAFKNSPAEYGESLSYDDFNNGERKIMLPSNYSPEYVGEIFKINGENYKVIGIDSIDEYAMIPFVNSPDSLCEISEIYISTKHIISQGAYKNLEETLHKAFGDYYFIAPVDTVDEKLPFYNSIMLICVILTCLSAIILALLFKYVLSTRNRLISVLRICGYTNNKVRHIFIFEIMITAIICYLTASIIYFFVIISKLKNDFIYIDIVYNLKNYLILSGIYLIGIYVILNLMIIVTILKSPVTQIKQGGI